MVPRRSVVRRVLLVLASHLCVGAVEEVVELVLVVAIEVILDLGKLNYDFLVSVLIKNVENPPHIGLR